MGLKKKFLTKSILIKSSISILKSELFSFIYHLTLSPPGLYYLEMAYAIVSCLITWSQPVQMSFFHSKLKPCIAFVNCLPLSFIMSARFAETKKWLTSLHLSEKFLVSKNQGLILWSFKYVNILYTLNTQCAIIV